ncbi:hypothetical protein [Carboxylicivirga marina]|uniref:N-acetyltransferase domain-containing protein n=1 Tax=Carboxylicivirga marina TaxID=2800988 RepID=A0ABS1HLE9_9BACT|nr:hypothetical protein [Carboxylicivirga marina]MBK3518500.1 hypothetical protein [Carboxylicivirga marina]
MMANDVWELMINTFEYERRRCKKEFDEICERSSYQLIELRNNQQLQGFIGYWDFSKWIAIEHLAVQSGENKSVIIPALLNMLLSAKSDGSIIISEIDIVHDISTNSDKLLFNKLGFVENPYVYIQPSYHKGCASFPQKILSYPSAINYESFKELRSILYRFVYGKKAC